MCLCNNIIQSALALEKQKELEKKQRELETGQKETVRDWFHSIKARIAIPKE
ncbi:hypothetical protein [Bacillus massiliigorillae]|uniref:hypothetical protein n=1 Tax=Bacillus massiliigorillae TaxID=1243664 RepID=UPI00039BF43B|nr:hypothetical protein [Bacillus massiliigorillae]